MRTLAPSPPPSGTAPPTADAGLLRRAAEGDDVAFEEFYRRHVDALLGYCTQVLGSRQEAEDAVQQSFFDAHRSLARGAVPGKPKAWLYAIARNRSLSTLRSRREQPAELAEPPGPALTDEVERRADLQQLVRDLHALPEAQRSALVMFELGALSQADIAKVLDRRPAQVKSLVYEARSNLSAARGARQLSCRHVQAQLAVARGGQLNSRVFRHHLDSCDDCKAYLEEVRRQRRGLAVLLPIAPLVAAGGSSAGVGAAASGVALGRYLHVPAHQASAVAVGATALAGLVAGALAVLPGRGGEDVARPASPGAPSAVSVQTAGSPPAARTRPARPTRAPAATRSDPRPSRPPSAAVSERRRASTAGPPAPRRPGDRRPGGRSEPGTAPEPRGTPVGGAPPPAAAPQQQQAPTPPTASAPPPPAPAAQPPAAPAPQAVAPPTGGGRTNNGNHYGQIRGHPNNGNHLGQQPGGPPGHR